MRAFLGIAGATRRAQPLPDRTAGRPARPAAPDPRSQGAERQERDCFVEFSRLPERAFRLPQRARSIRRSRWDEVRAADAVIVGGAGAHSVTERYRFTAPLAGAGAASWSASGGRCSAAASATSSWPHALGGRVITDLDAQGDRHPPRRADRGGSRPIRSSPACRPGSTSSSATTTGWSSCRRERPSSPCSALCPNQAFRLDGLPVWGCQFHVELDERRILERAAHLPGGLPARRRRSGRASPRPCARRPVASGLLRRFVAALG